MPFISPLIHYYFFILMRIILMTRDPPARPDPTPWFTNYRECLVQSTRFYEDELLDQPVCLHNLLHDDAT